YRALSKIESPRRTTCPMTDSRKLKDQQDGEKPRGSPAIPSSKVLPTADQQPRQDRAGGKRDDSAEHPEVPGFPRAEVGERHREEDQGQDEPGAGPDDPLAAGHHAEQALDSRDEPPAVLLDIVWIPLVLHVRMLLRSRPIPGRQAQSFPDGVGNLYLNRPRSGL